MSTQGLPTATHPRSGWSPWRWIVACACVGLAAALFTTFVVRHSLATGRLAALPVYDDVVYLRDALGRLDRLATTGWLGLASGLVTEPPHAPSSTCLAAISFAIAGRHDWAPYAGNVLVVLFTFAATWRLARPLPAWLRATTLVLAACLPATAWSVHEFRPDLACGTVTAALLCRIVLLPARLRTHRTAVALGIWLGAALWIKPTVFPMTILLTGAALAAALGRDRAWRTPRAALVFAGTLLGTAGLVFLPWIVIAGRELVAYVWVNIAGSQRRFWTFEGSWRDHASYYLVGPGGAFGIGRIRYLLAAWLITGIVVCRGRQRRLLVSLAVVLGCAYLLPTLNEVKSPFFGAVFYDMCLFATVAACGRLWRARPETGRTRVVVAVLLVLSAAIAVARFRMPQTSFGPHGDAAAVQRAVVGLVRAAATDGCRIAVPNTGWVNAPCLAYALARDGVRDVSFEEPWMCDDLARHREILAWADIVVASEPGTGLVEEHHPAAALQPALLELAGPSTGHVEVGRVPTQAGPAFHVFARPAAAPPPATP